MHQMVLSFNGINPPQLEKTVFVHPLLDSKRVACRGKTCGVYLGAGTFQWSPAVRALVHLLLQTASWARRADHDLESLPRLQGESNSPASSLDYALGKQPNWLLDMFGVTGAGQANARRLIHRSNPERRRPGPVILAMNPSFFPPEKIEVIIDNERITQDDELQRLAGMIMTH